MGTKKPKRGDRDGINRVDVWAAKKRQEGKRWLFRVWDADRRTYLRKAWDDEAAGEEWAKDQLAKFRLKLDTSDRPTVASVGKEYVQSLKDRDPPCHPTAIRAAEIVIAGLQAAGANDMKAPTFRSRVQHYLRTMKGSKTKSDSGKLAVSTKARNLVYVRAIVNYAVANGMLVRSPIDGLDPFSEPDAPRETLSVAELRRIAALNRRSDPLWLWFLVLVYTGLRRAESFALRWEDIDWEGRLVRVRKGKGNKARVVPLQDELYELLSPIGGPDAKTTRVGRITSTLPKTDKGAWAAFRRLLKDAKVSAERGVDPTTDMPLRLSPHSCRHTYAALQLATGTDSLLLRMSMGHSEDDMTEHYARQTAAYKRQVEHEGWKRGQFRLIHVPESAAKNA